MERLAARVLLMTRKFTRWWKFSSGRSTCSLIWLILLTIVNVVLGKFRHCVPLTLASNCLVKNWGSARDTVLMLRWVLQNKVLRYPLLLKKIVRMMPMKWLYLVNANLDNNGFTSFIPSRFKSIFSTVLYHGFRIGYYMYCSVGTVLSSLYRNLISYI